MRIRIMNGEVRGWIDKVTIDKRTWHWFRTNVRQEFLLLFPKWLLIWKSLQNHILFFQFYRPTFKNTAISNIPLQYSFKNKSVKVNFKKSSNLSLPLENPHSVHPIVNCYAEQGLIQLDTCGFKSYVRTSGHFRKFTMPYGALADRPCPWVSQLVL